MLFSCGEIEVFSRFLRAIVLFFSIILLLRFFLSRYYTLQKPEGLMEFFDWIRNISIVKSSSFSKIYRELYCYTGIMCCSTMRAFLSFEIIVITSRRRRENRHPSTTQSTKVLETKRQTKIKKMIKYMNHKLFTNQIFTINISMFFISFSSAFYFLQLMPKALQHLHNTTDT